MLESNGKSPPFSFLSVWTGAVAAAVVSDTQLLQQLLPHGKDSGALFLQFFSSY